MADVVRPTDVHQRLPSFTSRDGFLTLCEEIGDRLRQDLTGASPLPTRLRKLVDQIAELEGNSPPIIPNCEDEAN